MQFQDKVVVVTGSSSGIGKAVAEAFAQQGAKLVINSKTSTKSGEEIANGIIAKGGTATYLQADVANPAEVSAFFEKIVGHYGTVDILVNNV
jgi:NAD(P)-dependent dehydrogenase (short-subunit alcohol dehydrogenase family)